jgi:transposase
MDSFPDLVADVSGGNVAGVDTHRDFHVAAVVSAVGQVLATDQFRTDSAGCEDLRVWMERFGPVDRVGVEGTGSWGKGLTQSLLEAGHTVVEVNRPNRQRRRRHGKSDVTDAIAAALAVISGDATARAKSGQGPCEQLRMIHNAREGAVKARTAAINEFHAQIVTGPPQLRDCFGPLRTAEAVGLAARYQPGSGVADTVAVAAVVLASLAKRIQMLDTEIKALDQHRRRVLDAHAPIALRQRCGVGDWVAAQLLITVGDNRARIHSEASLAALCGVSCVSASSGKHQRHRLNRGGDRQANRAIYTIALTRMRHDPRTRAYVDKRTKEGKTTREIIRCLKRYIVRELYHDLTTTPLT